MRVDGSARVEASFQNRFRSNGYCESIITRRIDFAADCWSFRVEKPSGFSFHAGQHAYLAVNADSGLIERPCSIASSPHEPDLEFFLELVPGGQLTTQLYKLYAGHALLIKSQPAGQMKLQEGEGVRHLIICTGTGVAPFLSIVRTLHHRHLSGGLSGQEQVLMVNAAQSSALPYRDELAGIAAKSPWFTYAPLITKVRPERGSSGVTDEILDFLENHLSCWGPTPNDTLAYLCGQPEVLRKVTTYLCSRGFPPTAVKRDS